MSWSINAVGKAPAVAASIADQVSRYKCSEPEETIKNGVATIVGAALAAMSPGQAVRVAASGSQSVTGDVAVNQLTVTVEPIWGFLESELTT